MLKLWYLIAASGSAKVVLGFALLGSVAKPNIQYIRNVQHILPASNENTVILVYFVDRTTYVLLSKKKERTLYCITFNQFRPWKTQAIIRGLFSDLRFPGTIGLLVIFTT
jgi:hypothetical protein